MREVLFFVAAVATLAGALGVIVARNPVHSALFLVMTLVSVAVLFLLRDAQLVAAVQIIIYASAIVVLFLFVIMLLGVDRSESLRKRLPFQRSAAVALGAVLVLEVVVLAGHEWATGSKTAHQVGLRGGGFGSNIQRVARVLFTDFLWAFELVAVLLVIAVVGSVVLARRSGQKPIDVQDLTEPEAVGASEAGGDGAPAERVGVRA